MFLPVNSISPGSLEKPSLFAMTIITPKAEMIIPARIKNFPKFCSPDSCMSFAFKTDGSLPISKLPSGKILIIVNRIVKAIEDS